MLPLPLRFHISMMPMMLIAAALPHTPRLMLASLAIDDYRQHVTLIDLFRLSLYCFAH